MSSTSVETTNLAAGQTARTGLLQSLARRGLLAKLHNMQWGRLELVDGEQRFSFGQTCADFPEPVRVTIHHPEFYADAAFGGTIGVGESYMLGHWQCDNLVGLMRIMLANRRVLDEIDSGSARLKKPFLKLFHWLHRNTVKGSRRNIHAHYDLGNDFFRHFLDDTLMYSSAVFDSDDTDLKTASIAKLDRICQKLELKPGDHVLEIGTGWGGFAIHAATHYGCRVTTTTISAAQYELAKQRIAEAGLAGRVTLLQEDFRNLQGQYDKIVSIEMIEAIGERNIGQFFAICDRALKPGGRMLLQAITIREQLFASYRKSVDFIQRYIFPGGFLPSIKFLEQEMGARSTLSTLHLEDIGQHYATTLRHWRKNFHLNGQGIRQLGFSDQFMRMWEFYFCYCEAGFLARTTGDVQMLLEKDR